MLYHIYFENFGTPVTGLTPDWEYLLTAENGNDKSGSAPSITEVGGGWYKFDITFGTAPWDVTGEDLLGVIDGGASVSVTGRWKPVSITKRGLALVMTGHKGVQNRTTGDVTYYGVDGATAEFKADMTDNGTTITRDITAP